MRIKTKILLEFKDYSERRKKNLAGRLRNSTTDNDVAESSDGGGDYWIRLISAINRACKQNDNTIILDKISEIEGVRAATTARRTINQYNSNIDILNNFIDFNFLDIFPENFNLLQKRLKEGEIEISQFQIKVKIHQLFTFNEDNNPQKIGALLFVARKKRYSRSELGLFTELMFRFLDKNYRDEFTISTENIICIDVMSTNSVKYSMIEDGQIPSLLTSTLTEIRNLL